MCSLHLCFFPPANQINAAISAATLRSLLIKKQHLPQDKPSSSAYVFVFVRVSPPAPLRRYLRGIAQRALAVEPARARSGSRVRVISPCGQALDLQRLQRASGPRKKK